MGKFVGHFLLTAAAASLVAQMPLSSSVALAGLALVAYKLNARQGI